MLAGREERIVELTRKLGLPLEEAYLGLLKDGSISRDAVVKLIRISGEQGRLDELEKTAAETARRAPDNEGAKMLMRFFGFMAMAKAGDIETLYETARKWAGNPSENVFGGLSWEDYYDVSPFALMALGRTGDKGFKFLREEISDNWLRLMHRELGEEIDDWEIKYTHEALFAIHALRYFEGEKATRFLFELYKTVRKAFAEEEAQRGEELDTILEVEIATSIRRSGSHAGEMLLRMLDTANDKDRAVAKAILSNFQPEPLVEALDSVYKTDTEKKLKFLYATIVESGKPEFLVVPDLSRMRRAFISYGEAACLFALRKYDESRCEAAASILEDFDSKTVRKILDSVCKDNIPKRLELLFNLCCDIADNIAWSWEESWPVKAFLALGSDASRYTFKKLEATMPYPETLLRLAKSFPPELAIPEWERLSKSEDETLRELAEYELHRLKRK